MRVLIYSTAYFPFVGGAEVAVKEITDRIEDIEFVMITALMDKKLPKKEKIGNVLVYRIGFGIPKIDKIYLSLFGHKLGLKLHRQNKFDIVWSIMASFNGFSALKFKEKSKVKFLLTLQEGDPIEYILKKVKLVRSRFNKIFTQADALQPISTYLKNWGEKMGFKGEIKEVIPNGVDLNKFLKRFGKEEKDDLRKELNIPKNAFVLTTASRLVKKNGISDVIKAIGKLKEKIYFIVCGSGGLENELKELTKKLNLEEQVKFLGNVSHEKLPLVLQSGSAFIRPSLTEGLGNSFLEAMACQTLTIATPVGGIVDFLKDDENGFFCEPENPDSIVKVIEKIQSLNEVDKQKIKENGLKTVKEKYDWDIIAKKQRNIFEKLNR